VGERLAHQAKRAAERIPPARGCPLRLEHSPVQEKSMSIAARLWLAAATILAALAVLTLAVFWTLVEVGALPGQAETPDRPAPDRNRTLPAA